MSLKRLTTLTLMASVAVALLSWDLARSKPRKTVVSAKPELDLNHETGLILQGTLIPMITTPIAVSDLKLMVPLNTQVQQGEVIGIAPVRIAPAEMGHAQSELADASSGIAQAEERLREVNEELTTKRAQANNMSTQEIAAENAELEAESEFARRETLLRSGLASELSYDAAAVARASADAALTSLRSDMAATQVEIDQWEARAAEAQANLAAATERGNAARALAGPAQHPDEVAPVVSPADGMIVVSEDPVGTSVGIASDPGQLCAYATLRQADLTSIRIGQQALVVLDGEPAVTLQARVTAIAEMPLDSPEGAMYPVGLSVENPGRTWLSGVAVHVLIERPAR
jgi:multidrug resistance efflux pump